MWKLIVGSPWALPAIFAIGVAFGGATSWYVQGLRLDSLRAKYDGFITSAKAQGEAAKNEAAAKAKADRQLKESSDREYKATIASLRYDVKRMRDERARASFVPAATADSRSPGLACFDRAELERTIRGFDDEISGLIAEGDANSIGLNTARRWAHDIAPD